jgi:hypothetical protein
MDHLPSVELPKPSSPTTLPFRDQRKAVVVERENHRDGIDRKERENVRSCHPRPISSDKSKRRQGVKKEDNP